MVKPLSLAERSLSKVRNEVLIVNTLTLSYLRGGSRGSPYNARSSLDAKREQQPDRVGEVCEHVVRGSSRDGTLQVERRGGLSGGLGGKD